MNKLSASRAGSSEEARPHLPRSASESSRAEPDQDVIYHEVVDGNERRIDAAHLSEPETDSAPSRALTEAPEEKFSSAPAARG